MDLATEVLSNVQQVAECIKNDELQASPQAASQGDYVRQGDVYITFLECLPEGCVVIEDAPAQVAPGKTQGSRHQLSSLCGVTQYQVNEPNAYDGPILECREAVTLTHPEHGDWLLPAGFYAISFQRTIDSEGRIQKVLD